MKKSDYNLKYDFEHNALDMSDTLVITWEYDGDIKACALVLNDKYPEIIEEKVSLIRRFKNWLIEVLEE